MTYWIVAALVIAGFALYLSSTAGRLDRLHLRLEADRLALDRQLQHRCGVAAELVAAGELDPASALLVGQAIHQARTADREDVVAWAGAESNLTRALGLALEDPDDTAELSRDPATGEVLRELAGACRRVQLTRRFLDDGVNACRVMRNHRMVRWFRLAGHAPWPMGIDFEDTPPEGLTVG